MNRADNKFRRAKYAVPLCGSFALCLIAICAAKDRPERVNLFPRVQAGQRFAYQISYHSDKHVNTQSTLIVATPDNSEKTDVNALLRLEILAVQVQGGHAVIRARSKFEDSDSHFNAAEMKPAGEHVSKQDSHEKFVEFTILPDGNLDQIVGLDAFLPEQQQAWQEWASRFLLAAAVRGPGVRLAQKWNSEEAEKSSSPIAGLRWTRESTYVRDEPCRTMQLTVQGSVAPSDAEPETCAVILTNAALKQNSKAKNTTPEDFKLHDLRTTGTAQGANRIITYISLKTGLLIRASEEATQKMNVTVAKADGSNRVHYDVDAKSRSEVVMVSETPLNNR
jgi:hypothetical protein